jgi:hypothetical protein
MADNNFKERGFPGAVRTDYRNAVSGADIEGNTTEKDLLTINLGYIGYA